MTDILADTCIWVDYWRHEDTWFHERIIAGKVLMHPFVIGEIDLGNLPKGRRKNILQDMHNMPSAERAEDYQVLDLIERHALHGSGIGYVDAHLLASCRLSDALLFTRDRRLKEVAAKLKLAMR